MTRERSTLLVPGAALLACGLALFTFSHMVARNSQCPLLLAGAGDTVAVAGCRALMAADLGGDILWSAPYRDLGIAGPPRALALAPDHSGLLAADAAAPALIRCDWPPRSCRHEPVDAGEPFHVASTGLGDWLIVPDADTVEPLGEALALPSGLRFRRPAGIAGSGPELWVADTGNRRLLHIRETPQGTTVAREVRVVTGGSGPTRPLAVLPNGDRLWLIVDDGPATRRRLVQSDVEGTVATGIRLPEGAHPHTIAPMANGAVLVSDGLRPRLYQVHADGSATVEPFSGSGIGQYLRTVERTLASARAGQRIGYLVLAAGVLLLFVHIRARSRPAASACPAPEVLILDHPPEGVHWIRPQRQRLLMPLLGTVLLIWVAMLVLMAAVLGPGRLDSVMAEGFWGGWPLYTVPIAIGIAMRLVALRDSQLQQLRIAGHEGRLLVQRGDEPIRTYDPKRLPYSDHAILLDRELLRLTAPGTGGFAIDELARHVFPLLDRSGYRTDRQLRRHAAVRGLAGGWPGPALVVALLGTGWLIEYRLIA